ncbi:Rpn family recombination-promoting nuclease/putative transposase [Clostridium guangxiense]|uniref:Rpn family recombination-promoting nuclease/putative transposase n=1 Tax=Clostridium guangxiense TaxID=1662055 RepID=UPI001E5DEFAF|nr:Rpn family recombination-promoting nuclease/putative transposase [Clostridium guangxiense]MCD2348047.1 Rpn family recombination-promoting nuclease/putative transposase [Clostridium guangxiense]
MCRLNPKVDFAFKKLFGSEENKDILIAFINSIIDENEQIKDIELKNPYNIADYRKGKMTILDIKAVDDKDVWYDIEMQISQQDFFDKRALYYWSKVYSSQIESGEDYEKLRKTISINILDFNYLKEEDFHSEFKIYNTKTMKEFSNMFEMHFIELNKFNKDYKELKTGLDRWIAFLSRAYELDKDNIPEELAEDKDVKKAIEKLDIMYLSKEEREIYENDLKALMDYRAQIKAAERSGRIEGIKEGDLQARISIARNFLDVLDDETIAIKVGLSIDEIKGLRNK